MSNRKLGRILLSVVVLNTAVVSTLVDWNASHLFNPEWHPHARFHDVAMLWLLASMSVVALWLLWRRSREPYISTLVATLVPVLFWLPFFFTTALVPGTSLNADPNEALPQLLGITIYPNVVVAAINEILAGVGFWLYQRNRSELQEAP
ncbi:DUF6640 family protein [Leptolyngbya sp. FACHB-261]|uniref:DUF6640 family protein n=1 Tax=Leptolyngbya sp. FACHB-261 TaxID=2692806 RepID=UPI001685557B|nr:DUF6640 family protein [Leptolyngbya sp. FACHB-261]MBD2102831.1 hypothetical protein [Leptolyngbya sp. FACHB-261]